MPLRQVVDWLADLDSRVSSIVPPGDPMVELLWVNSGPTRSRGTTTRCRCGATSPTGYRRGRGSPPRVRTAAVPSPPGRLTTGGGEGKGGGGGGGGGGVGGGGGRGRGRRARPPRSSSPTRRRPTRRRGGRLPLRLGHDRCPRQPTDAELRERLTPEQFHVTQEAGTEPASPGSIGTPVAGHLRCIVCGEPLFSSETKYDSAPARPRSSSRSIPRRWTPTRFKLFMPRTEWSAPSCAHLGHVFKDGPLPTGPRYCMNSAARLDTGQPTGTAPTTAREPGPMSTDTEVGYARSAGLTIAYQVTGGVPSTSCWSPGLVSTSRSTGRSRGRPTPTGSALSPG